MNVIDLFAFGDDGEALTLASSAGDATRSFRRLGENVGSLCVELRRRGVGPGHRILVLSGTRIETVEFILAAFGLGAVVVPISPLLGARAIETIARRSNPVCCVFDEPLALEIETALRASCSLFVSLTRDGRATSGECCAYEDLVEEPCLPEPAPVADESPCLVTYSSGSQGEPKGVELTHGSLRTFLEHYALLRSQFSCGTADGAVVTVLPLSHLGGLSICLHGLLTGCTTQLMSHFLPKTYLQMIARARSSLTMLVPSMYRALLKEQCLRELDFSALRFCMTLGEPCPDELAAQIEASFGATTVSAYGLTECLTGIGHARENLWRGGVKRGSCGTVIFGLVKLLDEHGNDHAELGELWVKNPTVRSCYLDPRLNADRLMDGWFRTGDVFYRDPDGHFFHRGRSDDMFVCNGKNIYPVELERVLMSHPAVELACAAPVQSRRHGTVPGVLIIAKRPVSEVEILDVSARLGPTHAVPKIIEFVDRCPEVGPGKIDRSAARRLLQTAYDRAYP